MTKQRIRFRKTNDLFGQVRKMVELYNKDRNIELSKRDLRRATKKVLVAIEEGAATITLSEVRAAHIPKASADIYVGSKAKIKSQGRAADL